MRMIQWIEAERSERILGNWLFELLSGIATKNWDPFY